jgi:hypothetical protein
MLSDIFDRHVPRKLQSVTGERSGVAPPRLRKGQSAPPDFAAGFAKNPMNRNDKKSPFRPNWHCFKLPFELAFEMNVIGAATGAAKKTGFQPTKKRT